MFRWIIPNTCLLMLCSKEFYFGDTLLKENDFLINAIQLVALT